MSDKTKPTGTRDDPLPADQALPMCARLHIVEEREDGILFNSPDVEEWFFASRDQTFTREQERRIIELIDYVLRRGLDNASHS